LERGKNDTEKDLIAKLWDKKKTKPIIFKDMRFFLHHRQAKKIKVAERKGMGRLLSMLKNIKSCAV
jgi:hypothetical protein